MRIQKAAVRTVFVALVAILWLPIVLFASSAVAGSLAMSRMPETLCEGKAQTIAFILKMASTDYRVTLHSMQELSDFVDKYCCRLSDSPKSQDYQCSCDKSGEPFSYEILDAELNGSGEDKTTPVLREIHPNHNGRRVVMFKDGHVELIPGGSAR
jgi:hypothetical protein